MPKFHYHESQQEHEVRLKFPARKGRLNLGTEKEPHLADIDLGKLSPKAFAVLVGASKVWDGKKWVATGRDPQDDVKCWRRVTDTSGEDRAATIQARQRVIAELYSGDLASRGAGMSEGTQWLRSRVFAAVRVKNEGLKESDLPRTIEGLERFLLDAGGQPAQAKAARERAQEIDAKAQEDIDLSI